MSRYIDFYLIGELMDSHGNVHYEDLKNLPVADVVERKRGEWRYGENDIGLDGYWCTVCGEFVLWDYKGTIDFIHRYNYCPNCGADMRKILQKD